jgi:hypothetical protein
VGGWAGATGGVLSSSQVESWCLLTGSVQIQVTWLAVVLPVGNENCVTWGGSSRGGQELQQSWQLRNI